MSPETLYDVTIHYTDGRAERHDRVTADRARDLESRFGSDPAISVVTCTTPDPAATVDEHWAAIDQAVREAAETDPAAALAMANTISGSAAGLTAVIARRAHAAGLSWAQIAAPLEITKQGAYDRYRSTTKESA